MRFCKYLLIILLTTLIATKGFCSSDSLMHAIMLRLNDMQVRHEAYFPTGLYPCYRQYARNTHKLKFDDNIFFTGLIGITLKRICPQLSDTDKAIADTILARIKLIAPKYKNKAGRDTYNFWPTDTPKIFPNGGWLNWFDRSLALADDFDDTSIMLLALGAPDSVAAKAHELMQHFTNSQGKAVKTAPPAYRHFDAYSIWFGKKMITEFDPCVMANTLYMVQQYGLAWQKGDSTSLAFIVKMVESGDYITQPDKIAVYYKTTPLILYHLARLMSYKPIEALEKLKPQLIAAAQSQYSKAQTLPDKIILRTALLRWGVRLPAEQLLAGNIAPQVEQDSRFIFFIANLACTLPAWMAYPLFNAGITQFHFYCPAYNDALLLEYLAEEKKFSAVHQ